MTHLTDLAQRAAHAVRDAGSRLRGPEVLEDSWDEALALAAEYDRRRGYDRPRKERSKESHEMAEGAPVVRWTPPSLRPHA